MIADVRKDLDGINIGIADVKKDLDGINSGIADVKKDLDGINSVIADVRKDLDGINSVIANVKKDLDGINSGIADVKKDLDGINIGIADVKKDLDGINSVIANVKKDLDGINSVIADVKKDLDGINSFPASMKPLQVSLVEEHDSLIEFGLYEHLPETALRQEAIRLKNALLDQFYIAKIELKGVSEAEVIVDISQDKLDQYRLSLPEVIQKIAAEVTDISIGSVSVGYSQQERSAFLSYGWLGIIC